MGGRIKGFFGKVWNGIPKDHMKQRIFMIVVVVLICVGFAYINAPYTAFGTLTPHEQVQVQKPLLQDSILEQHFTYNGEAIPSMIGFDMRAGNQTVNAPYNAKLLDSEGTLLCEINYSGEAAQSTIYMGLPSGYDARGEKLTLQITSQAATPDNAMAVVTEPVASGSNAQLTINGKAVEAQQLSMMFGSREVSGDLWLVSMLVLAAAIVCILLWNQKLSRNALIVAIIFGVLFCLITPILDTPDEQAHFSKSLMMGNGDFFVSTEQGNEITTSYDSIHANMKRTLADTDLHGIPISTETRYSDVGSTMLFTGYLPQGLGLALAKLFSLDILPTFYLGRILNLIFYAVLAWLAVRMAKKFKLLLAVVAMMPMALYISASYNPDATLYGLVLVLAAYFINLYFDRSKKITYKEILIFAVICTLIAMKKYNYAPFLFLLCFIPKERYASRRTKYLGCLLTFAIVAASILIAFFALTASLAGSSDALVGGTNDVGANMYEQLKFAVANKGAVLPMLVSTIVESFGGLLQQLFLFGWMNYAAPNIVSIVYLAFIALIAFSYTRYESQEALTIGNTRVSVGNRIGIFLVMMAIAVISYLMMYLTWTPVGLMDIWGMQGRYLVPIFCLLPFIGQNTWPLVRKDSMERSVYNIFFAATMFIVFSLLKTAAEYY